MEENFAENWEDISFEGMEDEPEEDYEGLPTEESESAEETEDNHSEEPETQETFTLKYNHEEKGYTREEVIPLAQKGLDYDRIRGKLDEANEKYKDYDTIKADLSAKSEQIRWFEEMAKEQGMTVDEMIDATRATVMSRKTGKDIEVCKGIVRNERRERELDMERERMTDTKAYESKRDSDIREFLTKYPDLKDPKSIPQEVWDAVHKGETLVSAYEAYQNKQKDAEIERLRAELEKSKQKEKNKARSTGSQKKDSGTEASLVEEIWNSL